MTLPGKAAIAMWWNMAIEHRHEFEDWHSHEHFPERMGIPGFLRGSRWADIDGGEGFFVMYELDDYAALSSREYLARLNDPTPWSMKLMPHHRAMVRSQCRVLDSAGAGVGQCILTLRASPVTGRDVELRRYLARISSEFAAGPGGVACRLLCTEAPKIALTAEQRIRGGKDAAADWIFIAMATSRPALEALRCNKLSEAALEAHGAQSDAIAGVYQLAHAVTVGEQPL